MPSYTSSLYLLGYQLTWYRSTSSNLNMNLKSIVLLFVVISFTFIPTIYEIKDNYALLYHYIVGWYK